MTGVRNTTHEMSKLYGLYLNKPNTTVSLRAGSRATGSEARQKYFLLFSPPQLYVQLLAVVQKWLSLDLYLCILLNLYLTRQVDE